jgi:amino acid adenylation domain-containing protein
MNDLNQFRMLDVVSQIARCDRERTALVEGDRMLDYNDLHKGSNQIAHYLRSTGAGPESKIGVSIDRSIDYVLAVLGIVKSGAAYVPLDPSYPAGRRRHIVADAELQQILCAAGTTAHSIEAPVQMIALDSGDILAQPSADLTEAHIDPEQLAYVIYTSGSTGVPKGVEVSHGNLRHLVAWHNQALDVTQADRATLLANIGFDGSVSELWPYLCAGASIAIPPAEMIRDPELLRDWLLRMGISIFFAPTLLGEVLMATSWPADRGPRYLLTGGDTLRAAPRPGLPFRVLNGYGPTECTCVSTFGEVEPSGSYQGTPSIGYPISGVQILIVDEDLHEVPAGSPGEICIAGDGVARGYLNQPQMTAERFVRIEDGQRFYRSGDLGRYNADGSIQFLGRLDEQVKIRGYRIECGEIEAALNSLPFVQSSAVVLREQRAGHKALTAYVVPKPDATLSRDLFRQQLRSLLPEYMVPEQFVQISSIPVNENGKLDRRRLLTSAEEMIIGSTDQPSTQVESELTVILAKLLKVDQVDPCDDFFLLGGHSFVAAQLITRIRDHFGVELSLRTVFEHPTVQSIALQIEQRVTARL